MAEPGGSLDAVNAGGADAARFSGGASDLVVSVCSNLIHG